MLCTTSTLTVILYSAVALLLSQSGLATELSDEEPTVLVRSSDHFPNDLASLLNENYNFEKINQNSPLVQKLLDNKLLSHIFAAALNDKSKRDDDLPPGFIGVRGRRARRDQVEDLLNALRMVNTGHNKQLTNEQHFKGAVNKKSDSIAYKDGFLGVRG